MTITVTASVSTEALVYDKIFMETLSIIQTEQPDSSINPEYWLKINYKIFALDTAGIRHFKRESHHISIPDYYTLAATNAATGDLDLYNAMIAIEKALGSIIGDQGIHGDVTVTL